MKLDQWRQEKGLSYEDLARQLEFTNSMVYRFCTKSSDCIKLKDATRIVKLTMGQVDFCDLVLEGDC